MSQTGTFQQTHFEHCSLSLPPDICFVQSLSVSQPIPSLSGQEDLICNSFPSGYISIASIFISIIKLVSWRSKTNNTKLPRNIIEKIISLIWWMAESEKWWNFFSHLFDDNLYLIRFINPKLKQTDVPTYMYNHCDFKCLCADILLTKVTSGWWLAIVTYHYTLEKP